MDDESSSVVLESIHFNISLEAGPLAVLSVPIKTIPKIAWWLTREYGGKKLNPKAFSSIVLDDDGLSVVCSLSVLPVLQLLLSPDNYTLSPQTWRAFVINSTGSAFEFPGAVYCLANSLSKENLSILHISTFEAEVFLIQEQDLEKACSILKQFEDPTKVQKLIEEAWSKSQICGSPKNTGTVTAAAVPPVPMTPVEDLDTSIDNSAHNHSHAGSFDESWITPQFSEPPVVEQLPPPPVLSTSTSMEPLFREGFTLCVLPTPVILAKLRADADWSLCAPILTKLLLFDERFSSLEKHVAALVRTPTEPLSKAQSFDGSEPLVGDRFGHPNHHHLHQHTPAANNTPKFFWGLWQHHRETTLLLEESDVALFPPNCLVTSPQQWRVIKLCGRPISFDETGVVSAMSQVDAHIPSLNISTAITNCTLVPEELLDVTVQRLAKTLSCPVDFPALS